MEAVFSVEGFPCWLRVREAFGTGLSQGAVQELLWGFGAPVTPSASHGEAQVLCRKMSSVGSDGKGVTEMAVILAP